MIGQVLQYADLQELCRPGEKPRLKTVENWARDIGLRFRYDGKGGIISTVDALNFALGIPVNSEDDHLMLRPGDVLVGLAPQGRKNRSEPR